MSQKKQERTNVARVRMHVFHDHRLPAHKRIRTDTLPGTRRDLLTRGPTIERAQQERSDVVLVVARGGGSFRWVDVEPFRPKISWAGSSTPQGGPGRGGPTGPIHHGLAIFPRPVETRAEVGVVQQRRGVREVGYPVGVGFAEGGDALKDVFVEFAFSIRGGAGFGLPSVWFAGFRGGNLRGDVVRDEGCVCVRHGVATVDAISRAMQAP